MKKVIVHGCNGAMGKVVCEILRDNKNFEMIAGIDKTPLKFAHDFNLYDDIKKCQELPDVIIDFSIFDALPNLISFCKENKVPVVICTTGITQDIQTQINEASLEIPIFQSANMSLGINIISALLRKMTKVLHNLNFDIEIIEKHHNKKIDSPSGTALLLANRINNSLDNKLNYVFDYSNKKRSKNDLGIHSIRGGSIVGEHSIIFAGLGETIEIKHTAQTKEIFALGAIEAANFILDKSPRIYSMDDLIQQIEE